MARKSAGKSPSKTVAKRSSAKGPKATPRKPATATRTKAKPAHSDKNSRRPAPSKSGRKPLTIKTPVRSSAAAKAATPNKPVVGKSRAGSDKIDLKNKKPRTVAEAASEHKADAKGYVFVNGRRVRMISTKGAIPSKKPRNVTVSVSPTEDEERRRIQVIKTKLGRKELNGYRDLLLLKRRQLIGDLHAMEDQALRSGGGNLSHMPIHMADIGTDTFDQDFTLSLAENERKQVREIDAALQRIQDLTYGICQMTGKPIPKARLDAKPWAKYTVEAARIAEGQGHQ